MPTGLEKTGKNMLFGKTAITFAYELGLRRFLYKNSSTENFTLVAIFTAITTTSGGFAEFRFVKFGSEDRVFCDSSLDVVND